MVPISGKTSPPAFECSHTPTCGNDKTRPKSSSLPCAEWQAACREPPSASPGWGKDRVPNAHEYLAAHPPHRRIVACWETGSAQPLGKVDRHRARRRGEVPRLRRAGRLAAPAAHPLCHCGTRSCCHLATDESRSEGGTRTGHEARCRECGLPQPGRSDSAWSSRRCKPRRGDCL